MSDATFTRIFGARQGRATPVTHLLLRDAGLIADLKARISGRAARDDRARNTAWLIAFSPTRIDELTERSMFDAVLTSATEGERRLPVAVCRDWIEIGGGAMESSVRSSASNIERALDNAFRRVVLRRPPGGVDPAGARTAVP